MLETLLDEVEGNALLNGQLSSKAEPKQGCHWSGKSIGVYQYWYD